MDPSSSGEERATSTSALVPNSTGSSPTASGAILSRRYSWGRSRDSEPPVMASESAGSSLYEHTFHEDDPPRPLNSNINSQSSLDSPTYAHGEAEDETRLTTAAVPPWRGETFEEDPELRGDMNNRSPRRRYALYGRTSPLRSASVGGNAALRAVGRSVRRASVRVVNLQASGIEDKPTKTGDDQSNEGEMERERRIELPPDVVPRTPLWGRTLGLFGVTSPLRLAMYHFLLWKWTEPIILLLIFLNAIVLTVQSHKAAFSPPHSGGYFNSWEDSALFILFILFTLELLARVIVSGLILDPEIHWSSLRISFSLFRRKGPLLEANFVGPFNSIHRSPSTSSPTMLAEKLRPKVRSPSVSSTWRSAGRLSPLHAQSAAWHEAPFQLAIEKQRSLSKQGRPYLRHSWNRIDLVAVVSFWAMFVLSICHLETRSSFHIYIFRALSVLRISRLLAITSGTATIMRSLKKAGPLLVRVAFFVLFAMTLFSIIGVQSFKGSFRRNCVLQGLDTQDALNITLSNQFCGGYIDPLFLNATGYIDATGVQQPDAKGYICPLGQICLEAPSNPEAGIESFDNILFAAIQIVVLASVNSWSGVMYAMMDAEFFISCLFFIIGIVILNFWLINLFVAVITNTFSAIRAETKKSAFGADAPESMAISNENGGWSKDARAISPVMRAYEYTSFAWVLLALVSLGFQASKTSSSSVQYLVLLDRLELCFTLAFDIEITWRFIGHLPQWRSFFKKQNNNIDLLLALVSTVIQIPPIKHSAVYPWLTISQLARFYRVILFFPRMRPVLLQVFGNMWGLLNMTMFLLIMNFLGAIISVQLFRGDLSDSSNMNFSQTFVAFLAMYQVFSSENWTNVLYGVGTAEVPFKQAAIAILFFAGWFLFANFILLQMFIAVINENFEVADEQKRIQQMQAYRRKAEPPTARKHWTDTWNPYRYLPSRTASSMTLPSGLATAASTVPRTPRGHTRQGTGLTGILERLFGVNTRSSDVPLRSMKSMRRDSLFSHDFNNPDELERHLDILNTVHPDTKVDGIRAALAEQRAQKAEFIASHPSYDRPFWIFAQDNYLRRLCQQIVAPADGDRIFGEPPSRVAQPLFQLLLLLAVVGGIVVAAVATPVFRRQYYSDHGFTRFAWFDVAESTFGLVLVAEFFIKVIADGFIFTPNAYLLSIWNIVDFVIMLTLLVNLTTTFAVAGGVSRLTRALKAFRALRLITLFDWMRTTFHSVIFAGAIRILDAALLALLYMIPYAVWGLNIFSGLSFSCNDSSVLGKNQCFNEFISTPIDGTNLGFLAPRAWANPATSTTWSFDSFQASLLILFETVSLEGWIDVLVSAINIVGRDQQPQTNYSQFNAIFFLLYNLLGAVVILTLFVSVIIGNFSSRSGMALLTTEQRQWIDLQKQLKRQRPSKRPRIRPISGWRAWCYDRAVNKHGWWARSMTALYCIHIIALATQTFNNDFGSVNVRDDFFLVLTVIYSIDIGVRVCGLGRSFYKNGWNVFDVFVVVGTFVTTLAILFGSTGFVTQQLQKLFLVSIAFKLVQKLNNLNHLFKNSVASLPAILKLVLLWIVLFLFFGIVFVEVFSLTRWGKAETRYQNYTSLGRTLVMLAFMSTGEGWNQYMHNYALVYPFCTNSSATEPYSDCGSMAWAFSLFIAWNILSMYIFVNMFTGVVVENFSYVFTGPSSVTREEMRAFKKVWAEFDTERTGYLQLYKLDMFFSKLSGVFEVRIYPAAWRMRNIVKASQVSDDSEFGADYRTQIIGTLDLRKMEKALDAIDHAEIRRRRNQYDRLHFEAILASERDKGISFTEMLLLLARYKIIKEDEALRVEELISRKHTMDIVTDLVKLERVRSLLAVAYFRRQFLAHRQEAMRRRAEAQGIPEIIVDSLPSTPPPTGSRDITQFAGYSLDDSPFRSPDKQDTAETSFSVASSPTRRGRPASGDLTMLSTDLAFQSRDNSPSGSPKQSRIFDEQALSFLNTSVWGEVMRAAAAERSEGSDN